MREEEFLRVAHLLCKVVTENKLFDGIFANSNIVGKPSKTVYKGDYITLKEEGSSVVVENLTTEERIFINKLYHSLIPEYATN